MHERVRHSRSKSFRDFYRFIGIPPDGRLYIVKYAVNMISIEFITRPPLYLASELR